MVVSMTAMVVSKVEVHVSSVSDVLVSPEELAGTVTRYVTDGS